jgi:hypothetical protein
MAPRIHSDGPEKQIDPVNVYRLVICCRFPTGIPGIG